jgi:hypothetical protein
MTGGVKMELIIVLIALAVLFLMIRKIGVNDSNKNTSSNLQPLQNIPQPTTNIQPNPITQNPQTTQSTPTTQNISQNPQPQNNSNSLDTVIKAGLLGAAAGLGAGLLLGRNNYYNYYNYYNPYANPDTSLADHLHDLIWNNDCNKCDNDVIYNTFSSCDDTNPLNNSTCSLWDNNDDDNNNYSNDSSWNFLDNSGSDDSWSFWDSGSDSSSWDSSWDSGSDSWSSWDSGSSGGSDW